MASTDYDTMIASWEAALLADSASPQPTYTLDGKTVGQAEWRDHLQANISKARRQRNTRFPYVYRSARRM